MFLVLVLRLKRVASQVRPKVLLPSEKRQLAWNALLNAKDFNPQSIHTAAPVNLLNGSIKASGFAKAKSTNYSA